MTDALQTHFIIIESTPHCLKNPQKVAFEFLNFDIFYQFLTYLNWPIW